MTRTLRLAATLAVALAACGQNRSSIEVDGRAAPQDATKCTFQAGGVTQLGPGVLDVAFADRLTYSTVVYMKNNLADPMQNGGLTSSKAWTPYTAKVRVNPKDIRDQFGPGGLLDVTGENVLSLDGQTVEVNKATAQYVDLIGTALGQKIAAASLAAGETRRVVLGVSVQGRTQDGAFLESEEWPFSIDVCNGCLAAAGVPPTCPAGSALTPTNCFGFWQDTASVCVATK